MCPVARCRRGLRRDLSGSALPRSRNPFHAGHVFEASLVRVCYGLSGCSPPWTDLTGFPQPPGAFTSRLPTGWSPFPSLDITTTATGLLCWRDFHPQEWQLASLHQTQMREFGPAMQPPWGAAKQTRAAAGQDTSGTARARGGKSSSSAPSTPLTRAEEPDLSF